MKSAADIREEVLGRLEVLRERAKEDELDASRKVQRLIGADFNASDERALDELQAAVSRHRGHAGAVAIIEEAMAEIRNIRLS